MSISRRESLLAALALGAASWLPAARARADIPRLAKIRETAEPRIIEKFAAQGIEYPARRLYLRAFKLEGTLELWAASEQADRMTLIERYPICAASGTLGPKRRQGDEQVPEGFYQIHRYNAWSGYHMSLRVNYPNASDRVRGDKYNLGGAIMVHGDCVTIGCIPIEDRPIEEVFLAVLDAARKGRERVPIHIFPARMDDDGVTGLAARARSLGRPELVAFWDELRPAYLYFEATRRVPSIKIDPASGAYSLFAPRLEESA